MSKVSRVTVEGKASQAVEVKTTQSGNRLCEVSVPHQRRRVNKQANEWESVGETTWFRATFWGEDADRVAGLVEKGTLAQFRYLEHGAFYAILILSVIMYFQTIVHIPEVITGLGGATLIGIALWSSIRWNRQNGATEVMAH